MPELELSPNRVDLWITFQDEIDDPRLLRQYHNLMSSEERDQHRRFAFDYLRHDYLVTRALCRTTLSRYVDVDPAQWVFERNAYGKPEILAPDRSIPLRFNLSNTRGLIACCVALSHDVGVDVEDMNRRGETVRHADSFFSSTEVRDLRKLDQGQQERRFFEYWTLKESYIKARGMGLSIPLDQFSFHLESTRIQISFGPHLTDDPEAWQFELLRPSVQHMMAVGIRRGDLPNLLVSVRRTVPFVGTWVHASSLDRTY